MGFFEKTADGKIRDITDELPFEIPKSWEWARLGSLVSYSMGKTPPRNEYEYWSNPKHPWVSIADMVSDGIISSTKQSVSEYAIGKIFKGCKSAAGTLLMSFKLTVGKVSLLGIDAFHNEAIISIYPYADDEIIKLYLFKLLPLLSQGGETKMAIKGNTLNSDSIDALLIPLPPLAEQARIVKKIEKLMPLIDEYDIAEQELSAIDTGFPERLKKSILQTAVQGGLIAQNPADEPAKILLEKIRKERKRLIKEGKIKKDRDESVIYRADKDDGAMGFFEKTADGKIRDITDELPFEIPDSWEWARLGYICSHNTGKTLDRGRNTGELREYITTSNLYWGRFELDEVRKMAIRESELEKCTAIKGDLLICEGGDAGRSAIWERETPICIQNHIHRLRFLCKVNAYYAYYYMMLIVLGGNISNYKKGVAIKSISSTSLSYILFPLPPLAEQARIVKKIEKLESLLDNFQKTLV
jgi:type I restriction enzyme S subunit